MKIFLISIDSSINTDDKHPHDNMPPMMPVSTASLLSARGNKVIFMDWREKKHIISSDRIISKKPNTVLIYFKTPSKNIAFDMMKRLADAKITVLCCGQHPAAMPEECLKNGATAIIVGDDMDIIANNAISKIKEHIRNDFIGSPEGIDLSRVEGIYTKKGQISSKPWENLDILPFLDPNITTHPRYGVNTFAPYFIKKPKWGFLLSSRGCPHDCLFCSDSIRATKGKIFCAQSPERVIEEILFLKKHHGINAIYFVDDIFSYNLDRAIKIAELLITKKINLPWVAQTHAQHLNSHFFKLAENSGCAGLIIGLESGSKRILKQCGKGLDLKNMIKVRKLSKKHSIPLLLTIIFGHPNETVEDMEKTKSFVNFLSPDMVQAHLFTPYPGSRASAIYGNSEMGHHYNFHERNLSKIPDNILKNQLKTIAQNYYLSPRRIISFSLKRLNFVLNNPLEESKRITYFLKN